MVRTMVLLLAVGCADTDKPVSEPFEAADTDTHVDTDTGGPCDTPSSLLDADGASTGLVQCADGAVNRSEAVTCDPDVGIVACPPPGATPSYSYRTCDTDADCTDSPGGRCAADPAVGYSCGCLYPCTTDADCGPDAVCVCGGAVPGGHDGSTCVPVHDCETDADCPSGECGIAAWDPHQCDPDVRLACRTATDGCRSDTDCAEGEDCAWWPHEPDSDSWACRAHQGTCD